MTTLPKNFDPSRFEHDHFSQEMSHNAFAATGDGEAFCIMMPPPNVTGRLHMGHALNTTLQDILVRYHRMGGYKTLWQPGTDHAGIATQALVERQLETENKDRHSMGREAFLKRVWQWKEESGHHIVNQLQRLGASAAWERARFTLDDGLSHAVRTAFVRLYHKGLIYRGLRLVNWDPVLATAISDLEVETRDVKGHLWHISYPLIGGGSIVIATTRPETMAGDSAVAVHPDDERYRPLIGKECRLPLFDRTLPIIADSHADPTKGSGAVKITPAHDFNDFAVGERHNLPMPSVFDGHARYNDEVPERWRGMDRFAARALILKELAQQNLLLKEEESLIPTPHGDRSGAIIEPHLTSQWFVDTKKMAQRASQAMQKGDTIFIPDKWNKTYQQWLADIQPWCISRQIWWGHRIPAWYDEQGHIFVAMSEQEAMQKAQQHHSAPVTLTQDSDVLDTWFSSSLWPFSTLGWPNDSDDMKQYYPTSVLVTGFDIIFFWVARMMMMSLELTDTIPFRKVYVHALVRDAKGQKMSKSKGNVIDPLQLVDDYGADSLRFTLAALTTPGRDIRMDEARLKGYRHFATKLWNVTRFCLMNECRAEPWRNETLQEPLNLWMVSRLNDATRAITHAIENGRFDMATHHLLHLTRDDFCDWYVELAKPLLRDQHSHETRHVTGYVLHCLLRLMHPFMPFVSAELWHHASDDEGLLVTQSFPEPVTLPPHDKTDIGMNEFIHLIGRIRTMRSLMNVKPNDLWHLTIEPSSHWHELCHRYEEALCRLARLHPLRENGRDDDWRVTIRTQHNHATLVLPHALRSNAVMTTLQKNLTEVQKERAQLQKKLANEAFITRASEDVIAQHKTRLEACDANEATLASLLDSSA